MTTVVDSASRQDLRELRVNLHPIFCHQVDGRGPGATISARRITLCLGLYFLDPAITSLLSLDQQLREAQPQQLIGLAPHRSHENAPVVSDSTIRSALEGWPTDRIRAFGRWLYGTLRDEDLLGRTLPSGLSLNTAVVDTSSFGNCYSNVLTAVADTATYPLDCVAHEQFKRGKELPAARETIGRWKDRFELLLFDGLYLKQWVFDQCAGEDTADVLVKYPIKENREKAFPWPLSQAVFKFQKGLREKHTIQDGRYEDDATGYRMRFRDRGHEFVVDRFCVKTEGKDDFFTVCTHPELTVRDTWELSHDRWEIETNGFRALSLQNDSKDQNPRGGKSLPPPVKFTLIFWLLLFQSFFRYMEHRYVSEDERKNVKVTERWLWSCLRKYVKALFNGSGGEP